MEHYKELNKELIDINREMKTNIAVYQRELVSWRAIAMEQQRLRVESESYYRSRIVSLQMQNFREVLQEFTPNSGLLDMLNDWNLENESVRNSSNERRSDESKNRRSSQIVNEFRRSSAVYRNRSVPSMSPTRIRPVEHEEFHALAAESPCDAAENSLRENVEEAIPVDSSAKNENTNLQNGLQSIKEVSEVEAEEEVNILQKVATSRRGCPLRDINNQDSESFIVTRRAEYVNVRRGKPLNVPTQRQEDSIEAARFEDGLESENVNVLNSICSEGLWFVNFPFGQIENKRLITITVDETIRALNMSSFLDAPCSTPFNAPQTAHASKVSYPCTHYSEDANTTLKTTDSAETTHHHRPSRKCTPKSFAEPNLKKKLRNDFTGTLSTKKKKKEKVSSG